LILFHFLHFWWFVDIFQHFILSCILFDFIFLFWLRLWLQINKRSQLNLKSEWWICHQLNNVLKLIFFLVFECSLRDVTVKWTEMPFFRNLFYWFSLLNAKVEVENFVFSGKDNNCLLDSLKFVPCSISVSIVSTSDRSFQNSVHIGMKEEKY
jgi:hypothetical protein